MKITPRGREAGAVSVEGRKELLITRCVLFKEARGVLGLQDAVLKKLNNFLLGMSDRSRKQKVNLNTVWGGGSPAYVGLWNPGPHFSPPEQSPLLLSM